MSMLDENTISELKVLENPKINGYVKKALEDREFLDAILASSDSEDWPLRWGVSTVLVQVSKRSPELLKDSIPLLLSRMLYENKQMVKDNISQALMHLSRFVPEDFVHHKAHAAFVQYLKKGDDHKRFDATRIMENVAATDGEFVRDHLSLIEDIITDTDNPLIQAETQRVLGRIRTILG